MNYEGKWRHLHGHNGRAVIKIGAVGLDDRGMVDFIDVKTVIARSIDIAAGNCAMYYPEANILLSTTIDKESRTPTFKGEVVNITQ